MKDIYTVIIYDNGNVSTVSFLDIDDAIKYAAAEITSDDGEFAEDVREELEEQLFWTDDEGFKVYIEEAKLCKSFDGNL